MIRDEVASADIVGNHTWDHQSFTGKGTGKPPLTQAQVRAELTRASAAIAAAWPRGHLRHGPGQVPAPSADRVSCPGMERRPAQPLQQMLFETAEALAGPRPPRPAKLVSLTTA